MRITSKGQVTIPLAIRIAAGQQPNMEVEFVYENDKVLLRPCKRDTRKRFEAALKRAAKRGISGEICRRDHGIFARRMMINPAMKPVLIDSCIIIDLIADNRGV